MDPTAASPASSSWPGRILAALAAVVLAVGVARFWPWISDDSFIALRYSERLLAGQGLTFTDGERVEGYSNLLWILLCAALRPLGLPWEMIVRVLGIAATLATFWLLATTPLLRSPHGVARSPMLVLAALAPVSLWAIGGLEGPVAMFLLTAAYAQVGQVAAAAPQDDVVAACRRAGLWFALLALCRSEGPLWAALAVLLLVSQWARLLWVRDGKRWQALCWLGLPMVLVVVLHLACRLAYYGEWVPNTAHAKLATSPYTLAAGLAYLESASRILRSLWWPALLGLFVLMVVPRLRAFAVMCLVALSLWASYIAMIGGDWYPLCRYLQASFGPLVLLAGLGLRELARRRGGQLAGWALVAGCLLLAVSDARLDPNDRFQTVSNWEWRGRAVGEWLQRGFGKAQPLLGVDAAGAVPFYSGLPTLDMLGLCDSTIAKTPPPRPEHVFPAHSRGNSAHVLAKQPDLLLFGTPQGLLSPRWPGGWELEEQPGFLSDYRCVVFRTGVVPVLGEPAQDLAVTMRVRLHGRVGMRQEGDGWRIPGYLLAGHRQPQAFHEHEPQRRPTDPAALVAFLQQAQAMWTWHQQQAAVGVLDEALGAVVGELRQPASLMLDGLSLPAGRYTMVAEPPIDGIAWSLSADDATRCQAQADGSFRLAEDSVCAIRGTPRAGLQLPVRFRHLMLMRHPLQ